MLKKLILAFCIFNIFAFAFGQDIRLIIKLKPTISQQSMLNAGNKEAVRIEMMQPLSNLEVSSLEQNTGMKIVSQSPVATGAHVVIFSDLLNTQPKTEITDNKARKQLLKKLIDNIKSDPKVEYVEEDRILKTLASPNPSWQWDMGGVGFLSDYPTWVGDNFTLAWQDLLTMFGSGYEPGSGVIVAVLDTGYTPHTNFIANLQALDQNGDYGYQFLSDCRTAGSCPSSTATSAARIAYQPNGLDLGDYVSQDDINSSNGYFTNNCLSPTGRWR